MDGTCHRFGFFFKLLKSRGLAEALRSPPSFPIFPPSPAHLGTSKNTQIFYFGRIETIFVIRFVSSPASPFPALRKAGGMGEQGKVQIPFSLAVFDAIAPCLWVKNHRED